MVRTQSEQVVIKYLKGRYSMQLLENVIVFFQVIESLDVKNTLGGIPLKRKTKNTTSQKYLQKEVRNFLR